MAAEKKDCPYTNLTATTSTNQMESGFDMLTRKVAGINFFLGNSSWDDDTTNVPNLVTKV
jgi:hypothetical protein